MKRLYVFLFILCCGCSAVQPVEHSAPKIQLNDRHYITDRSEDGLKAYYEVSDEEGVEVEVSAVLDEKNVLCVTAVNEYEKSSKVCKQYETYDLDFDFDYQNSSLEEILQTYLKEHKIEEKVFYFFYNTVTEDELTYRDEEIFSAASTIKVAMCMCWTDLIQEGILSYDSTLYYDSSMYEASGYDLTHFYPFGSNVPLSVVMENSIVYSDNSCANMMWSYYPRYAKETYREWLSHLSPTPVSPSFYSSNEATIGLMLNVMKQLYANKETYQNIIDDMKIAAEGEYLQANTYPFDVAQKYGYFDCYEHAMGIMFTEQPILVGIFTELAENHAREVIADLSKIMVEYTIANL